MSRFYQTAQRNFQDDFIFQPDWNMAQNALLTKDAAVADQLDTLDLFKNLPIDFWKDADQENVKQIKEGYESQVNDIVKQMQGDLANTGNNKFAINSLRRNIENDYEFGKIRQIQDNAMAYRKYSEGLAALKNPADREGYKAMERNYLASAEQGAFSSLFKPDEMYNNIDVWGGFTASDAFKQLKPDERATQIENTNGRYMVTQGNKKVELSQSKIGQAFDAFLKSSNLEGYAGDRQKYFGQNWLDENGQIRKDKGSYIGGILETGIPSLAYSSSTQTRGLQTDAYGLAAQQNEYKKQEEARAASAAMTAAAGQLGISPEVQVGVADVLGVSKLRQQQLSSFIKGVLKPLGQPDNIHGHKKAYDMILNNPVYREKYKAIYDKAKMLQGSLNEDRIASKETVMAMFNNDSTAADKYLKDIREAAKKGSINIHVPQNGSTSSNRYTLRDLSSGNIPIRGERVIKNSVEFDPDDIPKFIPVNGSTDPRSAVVAIPVMYKVPGPGYYKKDKSGKVTGINDETDYVTERDYVYSGGNNFMKY